MFRRSLSDKNTDSRCHTDHCQHGLLTESIQNVQDTISQGCAFQWEREESLWGLSSSWSMEFPFGPKSTVQNTYKWVANLIPTKRKTVRVGGLPDSKLQGASGPRSIGEIDREAMFQEEEERSRKPGGTVRHLIASITLQEKTMPREQRLQRQVCDNSSRSLIYMGNGPTDSPGNGWCGNNLRLFDRGHGLTAASFPDRWLPP